jgi:endonuclease YncB( thermonuclease family)
MMINARVILWSLALSAVLFGLFVTMGKAAAPVVARGAAFPCTPTAVWDGDGPIWCREGPRIRLSGIAAREIDGACKTGHPCPKPSGVDARDHLVRLLGGATGKLSTGHVRVNAPTMACRSEGSAKGSRTAAWCITSGGVDLSCAMVASGRAERWGRYWRAHRC